MTIELRTFYPKCANLAYWWFWAVGVWNSKYRERLSLSSPYLPQEPPKGIQPSWVPPCPSPGVWFTSEDWVLSQERRLEVHTTLRQTWSQKGKIPTYSPTAPFIFPRNNLLPTNTPASPLPFPYVDGIEARIIKLSGRVTHFSPVSSVYTRGIHVNKLLLVVLLLIWLLLQGSQLRTLRVEGKICFSSL